MFTDIMEFMKKAKFLKKFKLPDRKDFELMEKKKSR